MVIKTILLNHLTHYTLGSLDKLDFMLAHNVVGNNYFSEHPYVCYIM